MQKNDSTRSCKVDDPKGQSGYRGRG